MQIIQEVFQRKRIISNRLIEYGFTIDKETYHYQTEILNGDFTVYIEINHSGEIDAKIIDKMNDEEYVQAYNDSVNNAFVNSVRDEFSNLLSDIADKCIEDILFSSEQANRIVKEIKKKYGVDPEFPWKDKANDKSGIFRHLHNQKWFALIMNIEKGKLTKDENNDLLDAINLKIDPKDGKSLRSRNGIFEAYHMNKKHWITVILDESISDDDVMKLIEKSFELTK
ncbi:MmcQ/YjbR family DNA-binding protein [Helcococcus kunzii]|uniref:MmcQ family protein n=1 Tax=Helcococcus kunzii ATCC 51366 TaxID=883114 RepID=H3NR33_9FIRM|nr:MmcQ/YjbR family DNA-binding protein [Helcococcus kunzii]EHR31838.1 hypothetical protein HMPREF9709_01794 [Helcococcus kunzii ATCC 51366]